mgnify:CR=1 FL=1
MKEQFKTIHDNVFETPKWLFDSLNKEFDFKVDLACTKSNSKCDIGLYEEDVDSLEVDWHALSDGWMWLNPPYSPIKPWIEKAQSESRKGAKIVCLIPPIITTRYFSKIPPAQIRFIVGRVNFYRNGIEQVGNTSDSCIVIYSPPIKPDIVYVNRDDIKKSATNT